MHCCQKRQMVGLIYQLRLFLICNKLLTKILLSLLLLLLLLLVVVLLLLLLLLLLLSSIYLQNSSRWLLLTLLINSNSVESVLLGSHLRIINCFSPIVFYILNFHLQKLNDITDIMNTSPNWHLTFLSSQYTLFSHFQIPLELDPQALIQIQASTFIYKGTFSEFRKIQYQFRCNSFFYKCQTNVQVFHRQQTLINGYPFPVELFGPFTAQELLVHLVLF